MGIYKYSYRFNASHNTSGKEDGRHTHSFEAVFYLKQQVKFFYEAEKLVNRHMEKYVGAYLNDVMEKAPTIENIAETIFAEINGLDGDFEVVRLDMSDSPVQTYIIGVEEV
ncbi:MAG: 6-carboxytetrahydropterin synthase [Alistipes sp.]|nr:6-carboxytetrahydropterin synthase [Alistipes sp.]